MFNLILIGLFIGMVITGTLIPVLETLAKSSMFIIFAIVFVVRLLGGF